ncbi:MAG: hypothetical protein C0189_02695 [Caldisericum exile]|jgi:hypothetical protein|uniref:Uncharacterized protein n=1 Tax=Caldisericum exile TaxID=693075 RepID=A0A2J6WEM0_9BACT|nr:MAG: hypothetical protein C0189_02695 [Caldisericum exile]
MVFRDPEELKQVLGGFFEKVSQDKEFAKKFAQSKILIRFNYSEPELSITLDMTDGENIIVTYNDKEKRSEVDMDMKADIAHKFWLGKLNLTMAITRKMMIVRGPVPRVLAFIPVLAPTYQMYKDYLKEIGREDLIEVG